VNSDAGISGDVTFLPHAGRARRGRQRDRVAAAARGERERERDRAEDLAPVHGLGRSKKDATPRIAQRR
jgi:hypothetical protein